MPCRLASERLPGKRTTAVAEDSLSVCCPRLLGNCVLGPRLDLETALLKSGEVGFQR